MTFKEAADFLEQEKWWHEDIIPSKVLIPIAKAIQACRMVEGIKAILA